METTEEAAEKRVSDAVRQLAINDVFEQYRGSDDEVVVEDALLRALERRGVQQPTEDWVKGVASDICDGYAYVMSPESMATAAAMELGEYPEYGGSTEVAGGGRRGQLDEGSEPATRDARQASQPRRRTAATVVTVIGLLVTLWALRPRRKPTVR